MIMRRKREKRLNVIGHHSPSSFRCGSWEMISPFFETQCSASYGVKLGGSSPPAGKTSTASLNVTTRCPALSSKDGGGTVEGPASPLLYARNRGCSESEEISLSLPRSVMSGSLA